MIGGEKNDLDGAIIPPIPIKGGQMNHAVLQPGLEFDGLHD